MSGPNSWWLDLPHKEEYWCYVERIFSPDECDTIIDMQNNPNYLILEKGFVGGMGEGVVNTDIRKSMVGWMTVCPDTAWIFQRITDAVKSINKEFYQYDLTHMESIQFTKYEPDSNFYGKHIDSMYETNSSRKLSVSVLMTDPEEFDGGDLNIYIGDDPMPLPKDRGTALFFPSWSLHEVTPVTRGDRISLVSWICGPKFK